MDEKSIRDVRAAPDSKPLAVEHIFYDREAERFSGVAGQMQAYVTRCQAWGAAWSREGRLWYDQGRAIPNPLRRVEETQ